MTREEFILERMRDKMSEFEAKRQEFLEQFENKPTRSLVDYGYELLVNAVLGIQYNAIIGEIELGGMSAADALTEVRSSVEYELLHNIRSLPDDITVMGNLERAAEVQGLKTARTYLMRLQNELAKDKI